MSQTPAVAEKKDDPLKKQIALMEPQFKAALPTHIPPERFVRVVQTALGNTPALLTANRNSFFAACMKSAQDGLLPDGKEAALVTFKNKSGEVMVQYMPMISGILKKVRNSGELSTITSQIVYEKDEFNYFIDADGEHISHKPNMFADRGKPLGVYALAKTKDGGVYIEVMTTQQVNDVKKVSRGANNGPWAGAFETEMWKKTVIRRLSKRLPMSTDLELVIKADDDLYDLDTTQQTQETGTSEPKDVSDKPEAPKAAPVRRTRLKKTVDEAVKPAPPAPPKDVTPEIVEDEVDENGQPEDYENPPDDAYSEDEIPL